MKHFITSIIHIIALTVIFVVLLSWLNTFMPNWFLFTTIVVSYFYVLYKALKPNN
jgi:hypothetical protein